MASPESHILHQLHSLDKSSPTFPEQLDRILRAAEYELQCGTQHARDDLMWLVDYLDKVCDDLSSSGGASEKYLSKLRAICRSHTVLPTSCMLSPHVLHVSPEPFTLGAYGDVYLASLHGSRVRVKRIRVPHPRYMQAAEKVLCQAAVMWKRLEHPNIVSLLGFTISPPQLVSNWMSNGDLPDYVKNNRCADVVGLLTQVAKGIDYLHSCDVIHREIKGSNVLVDPAGHARISDFGLAIATMGEEFAMVAYQPPYGLRWTAPEVLSERVCSKAADIFSFAMLMAEIFSGEVPFSDLVALGPPFAIVAGRRPSRPTHPALTERLWRFMQRCWDHDRHSRPGATEVLQVLLASAQR